MNQQERDKLEKVIAMGKWPYIFKAGVVAWGWTTFVLYLVISLIVYNRLAFVETLALFAAFSLAGFVRGIYGWHRSSERWTQLIREMLRDSMHD